MIIDLTGRLHGRQTAPPIIPQTKVPLSPIASILLTLTWTTFFLRLLTRTRIARCLRWDDAAIFVAIVFYTVFAAAAITDANLVRTPGALKNLKTLGLAVEWLLAAEVFYILTMLAFKISLGLFFLRITHKKWQRYVIYVAVTISTVFSIAYLFFAIFQCGVPKSGLVFVARKKAKACVGIDAILGMGYAHAAVVSATDWAFAILPILLLRKADLDIQEKVTVGFILVLGSLGSICSLVRFRFIRELSSTDINFPEMAFWSLLEPGIGIVANCLATLRPFVRQVFRRGRPAEEDGKVITVLTTMSGEAYYVNQPTPPTPPKNAKLRQGGGSRNFISWPVNSPR